jgi:hypothetical protein
MNAVLVLVDLSNTTVFRGVHRPNPAILGARLDEYLTSLGDRVQLAVVQQFCDLYFRLYDGWFDVTGAGTELYSMLRRHIGDAYPTRRRFYRMFVEIADAPLAARGDRLIHTFREQRGLTRHHIGLMPDSPVDCSLPGMCAVSQLRSWIKGKCPVDSCPVNTDQVSYFRHQKLVDTALVADIVWGASQGRTIVVVSDDEDVIPGLLTARSYGRLITWACRSAKPREPYATIIARRGVEYLAC